MIAIYGASVTQQKTGYAAILKKELDDEVRVFGYGGMHLPDAGLCNIDTVLQCRPSLCLVDWFSTGFNECSDQTKLYLDALIFRFTKAECRTVFLFFPHRGAPESVEKKDRFYEFCRSYLESLQQEIIDVDGEMKKRGISADEILRDNIHTNDKGSRLYADFIRSLVTPLLRTVQGQSVSCPVKENRYCHIKRLLVNREFRNRILLEGNCEILGLLLTVGPFSGMVRVEAIGQETFEKNTWDRWCGYTREKYWLSLNLMESAELTVLNDSFDTGSSEDFIHFERYRKKLAVHEIDYIGDSLRIANMEEGTALRSCQYRLMNLRGRIRQFLKAHKR